MGIHRNTEIRVIVDPHAWSSFSLLELKVPITASAMINLVSSEMPQEEKIPGAEEEGMMVAKFKQGCQRRDCLGEETDRAPRSYPLSPSFHRGCGSQSSE